MQLAQLNIAESLYPMTDARMLSFTGRIEATNLLAERSPGFIWRLEDDSDVDGALELRLPGDENTLVNMSIWADIESLYSFVYKTAHAKVMSRNSDNFKSLVTNHFVLWWIKDGHIPDLIEAKAKLDALRANGPSPKAFDFQTPFSESGKPIKTNFPKKDCA